VPAKYERALGKAFGIALGCAAPLTLPRYVPSLQEIKNAGASASGAAGSHVLEARTAAAAFCR
jgi:hypothetical protein